MYGSTGWPELIILLVLLTWAFRRMWRFNAGGRLTFAFKAAALTLIVLIMLLLLWNFSIQFRF